MNARAMRRLELALPLDPITLAGTTGPASFPFNCRSDIHNNRIIVMSLLAGGTINLCAAKGSGTRLIFIVGIVVTSNSYIIKRGISTDIIQGSLMLNITASTAEAFATAANSNTITLNGGTTGGASIGDRIVLEDIASGTWAVSGNLIATSAVATPFSNT